MDLPISSEIDFKAISEYNNLLASGTKASDAMEMALVNVNDATLDLVASYNDAQVPLEQYSLKMKMATAASKAFSVAANMVVTMLVIKGIQLVGTAISNYVNRVEIAIEKMEEAQNAISDSQARLREISSTISENKDRFLELSEGVGEFSERLHLSEDEYKEYLSISNQLAEISPTLVSGYDEQGNALLHIGENAEETAQKLNDVLETEKAIAAQTLVDNIDSVAEGIHAEVEHASAELATLHSELENYSTYEGLQTPENLFQDSDENTKILNYGSLRETLGTEQIEQLKNAILHSGARVVDDSTFDTMSVFAGDYNIVKKAIENFYAQIGAVERNESSAHINGIKKDIQAQEKSIKELYSKMNTNLSAWTKTLYEYDYLDDSQKDLIDSLIPTLDWETIKNEYGLELSSAEEYEEYIKKHIITPLMSIPDEHKENVNKKFAQLLEFESGDIDIVKFVDDLQNYLDSFGVTIDLTPLLGNTTEIKKNYEQITNDAALRFIEKSDKNYARLDDERKALDDFAKENSIDTQKEIAFWNKCLEESNTREEAMQKYLNTGIEDKNSVLSKSGMIDKISTELTDGFDILDEIYADVKDGKTFDFSKLASDKFKDAFKDLEDEYTEFIETVSASPNDLNACQNAFNKLTTAFINQSGILNELSDENASVTASYLKLMGVENAEIVVEDLLASKREYLAVTGKKLENATYEQIDAFIDEKDALEGEGIALDETSQKAVAYWMQKELISETPFSTLKDISQLDKLCGALGIASKAWRNYLYFKQLASMTDVYGEELTAEYAKKAESFFAEAQGDIQELLFGSNTFKYSGADKSNKSNKSSDSTDKHLEAYNKALKELQDKLKQELITERQFYDESEKLLNAYLKDTPAHIEKYKEEIADAETTLHGDWVNAFEAEKSALEGLYNDGAIPQKEYLARLKQIIDAYYVSGEAVSKYGNFTKEAAEQQREFNDLYDDFVNNAFDGFTLMLDKVISKYEEQRDAAEKAYEAQEKAIDVQIEQLDEQIDAINKQIDAVDKVIEAKQKEIDKIQEVNDEINKQIQYQKNLMALEEAQNNKSVAVLKGGKVGYDIDHSAVKDAKEAVRQDEEQKRIDAIEKEIKLLEERKQSYENEIELIELQKESLEKQQEAIQKMSEQSNEYFEKLIDSIEKYQSRFEDLQSVYQDAQIIDGMKGFLESIGTTPEQILNMSEDAFNKVKESYMKYVQDMSQNNESLMDSLNKTFQLNNIEGFEDFMKRAVDSVGLMGEIDLSSTTEGLAGVSEGLGVVGEAANTATASISTAGT